MERKLYELRAEGKFGVKVLAEHGHFQALLGLSLNKKQPIEKMMEVATRLSKQKNGSHYKFLRHIQVWLLIKAPLYWWKQFDTYTFADSQSESTMFTIMNKPLDATDFNYPISEEELGALNKLVSEGKFEELIRKLPSGFMQIREISLNYACLKNIFEQREHHKLGEWKEFVEQVRSRLIFSDLL